MFSFTIMTKNFSKLLTPPDKNLFYSRNDATDVRMGEIVIHEKKNYPSQIDIGIIGVPDDEGVRRNLGRVGAKQAPTAIRTALYKYTPFSFFTKKLISQLSIVDFGDVKIGKTLENTHNNLQNIVEELLSKNIFPIILGGGHDIAYPNFSALSQTSNKIGIINIDSHLDFRKPNPQRNSGTSFHEILKNHSQKISPKNFVELGIQSFVNSSQHIKELQKTGATIIPFSTIQKNGIETSIKKAYTIATKNANNLYVSFDIDSVKNSDAPGVSASLPTGLTAEEILTTAFFVGKKRKTKLIDIVEMNPNHDIDNKTAKLSASIIMYFLAGFLER